MTYKSIEHGYVFWQDELLLPMKKLSKEGKRMYFRKTIEFEDAPNYWEYVCEDGMWNVECVLCQERCKPTDGTVQHW